MQRHNVEKNVHNPGYTPKKQGPWNLKANYLRSSHKVVRFVWAISIVLVSYLSLTPQIEIPCEFSGADKVCHFLSYLWLAVLPFFAFERFKMALTWAVLMIPLGIGLEYAQGFTPGRLFSVGDMIANSVGVVLGLFVGGYMKSYSKGDSR